MTTLLASEVSEEQNRNDKQTGVLTETEQLPLILIELISKLTTEAKLNLIMNNNAAVRRNLLRILAVGATVLEQHHDLWGTGNPL